MTLYIDIETYSDIDLRKNSVYKYAASPEFQILFAWWAVDDGPVQLALGHEAIYQIPGLWDDNVLKVAHNAQFERISFSGYLHARHEMDPEEYLWPESWEDTMALAAEAGLPQKLENLAKALGAEEKDTAGTRLINLFCKPNRKGVRTLPEEKPEEWQQFLDYGKQDVVTLRDVHRKLPGWPTEMERQVYLADQRVNDLGIPVDVDMAQRAVEAAEDNKLRDELEMMQLTGINNPGSNPQLLGWLKGQGVEVHNLQAETIKSLLAGLPVKPTWMEQWRAGGGVEVTPAQETTETVRRVLELRQDLALVAAKKYTAALERVSADGRLRGSFAFFGAHTGRWAGRGVQLQNLPSATMETETHTEAAILDLKLGLGADAHALKALVRAMFTGPFTVVDYAAIEARVVAWLAGEEWALNAFEDGRDIYVETAERMGGMTRKEGKVAVLALGYNGGINSLRAMGADGTDSQLQRLVTQWRNANPAIVDLWAEMDNAFKSGDCSVGEHLYMEKDGADRYLRLPSGRAIGYHGLTARWKETQFGRRRVVSFKDPKTPGARVDTYGGRLVENVTQAVARDILAAALVRLQDAGYDVVGHVHDEILVAGASPTSVAEVTSVMVERPEWAKGLPIAGAGFTCNRYRKD